MKFKNRIVLSICTISLFFLVAMAVALGGMQHVKSRFESYLANDQAILMAGSNAYAQGLQMGQAVRNIILDPSNPTAYRNFEQAKKDMGTEIQSALVISGRSKDDNDRFKRVVVLREKQAGLQAQIIALAKSDQQGAIKLLNREETPLWREIKSTLLDFVEVKNKEVSAIKGQLIDVTEKINMASAALSLLAIILGFIVTIVIVKQANRQLGGEPGVAVEVAGRMAAGDLSVEINSGANDKGSLLFALGQMRDNLSAIVSEIQTSAHAIATASGQIAGGNQDLSVRNERQAASVEETASSMQQLTSSVRNILNSINQANRLTAAATDVATQSGSKVAGVISTMGDISESSNKIVDIISVIDGIAFQTNILALNAAVEAARAGENGKGFAVVASEVRHLAQRSATAAREIKDLIEDSVGKVALGSGQVNDAGATIDEVVQSIRRVQNIMIEVESSIKEQTDGIEVVNNAISQIEGVTQQNAALVEQAAAAAASLSEQSVQLVKTVTVFKMAK